MSKVKDYTTVKLKNEQGEEYRLHVLWYCDDETGYGVEYKSDDEEITSWELGDNSIESYQLSSELFATLSHVLKIASGNDEDKVNVISDEDLIIPEVFYNHSFSIENASPTEMDIKCVLTIINELQATNKKHPLLEKEVEELRVSFGWPKEKRLWSHLVQRTA